MFRKILLAAAVTAVTGLAIPTVLADSTTTTPPTTQPEGRRHPLERIREAVEQLKLTEDQKAKIHDIMEDARAQLKPILEGAQNGDRDKIREQVRDIVKETLKKITAVLGDEQKEHLRKILQEERAETRPAK